MAPSKIEAIIHAPENDVAKNIAFLGDLFVRRAVLNWASKEAAIVVAGSAALIIVGWLGARMIDPEPSIVVVCTILLLYILHVAIYLLSFVRAAWIAWQLRLPVRRLGLFFLYRSIFDGLEHVARAIKNGIEKQNWYIQGAFKLFLGNTSVPKDQLVWAIVKATEPYMWRYAIQTAAICVIPLLIVITTFRMVVTHGILLNAAAHLSVWEAILYPFAALTDFTFGTSLRAMLKHG